MGTVITNAAAFLPVLTKFANRSRCVGVKIGGSFMRGGNATNYRTMSWSALFDEECYRLGGYGGVFLPADTNEIDVGGALAVAYPPFCFALTATKPINAVSGFGIGTMMHNGSGESGTIYYTTPLARYIDFVGDSAVASAIAYVIRHYPNSGNVGGGTGMLPTSNALASGLPDATIYGNVFQTDDLGSETYAYYTMALQNKGAGTAVKFCGILCRAEQTGYIAATYGLGGATTAGIVSWVLAASGAAAQLNRALALVGASPRGNGTTFLDPSFIVLDTDGNDYTANTWSTATCSSSVANNGGNATITAAGSGYISVPTVTVARGVGDTTGVGLTATATLTNGVVTQIAMSGGSSYTQPPILSIQTPPDGFLTQGLYNAAKDTLAANNTALFSRWATLGIPVVKIVYPRRRYEGVNAWNDVAAMDAFFQAGVDAAISACPTLTVVDLTTLWGTNSTCALASTAGWLLARHPTNIGHASIFSAIRNALGLTSVTYMPVRTQVTPPPVPTNTLRAIRAMARPKVGLLPLVADASDPFLGLWAGFVSEARDQLVMELPPRSALGEAEVVIALNGSGAYDLTAYNFLRLDRVGVSDGTSIRWLNLDDPFTSLYKSATIGKTGNAAAVTFDGRLLAVLPWDNTTTSTLVIQGVRMPSPLSGVSDYSGLSDLCNEAIAVGAAKRVCEYDVEREDLFIRRLPRLEEEWKRLVFNINGMLSRQKMTRGGWRTAPVVNNVVPEGTWTNTAQASIGVGAMPEGFFPVTLDVISTAGASTLTATLDALHPVAVGWTAAGAVRAISSYMGEIFNVTTAPDRRSITATLPLNPDGEQMKFSAESVRFCYMSNGI